MSLITANTGSRQSLQTKECPSLLPTQEAVNHSKPKNVPHYCQHRKPSITPNQRMSLITPNTGSCQSLQTKECPLLLPTQEAVNHTKPKNVHYYCQHRKPSITPNQRMSLITANTGSHQSLQTKECPSLLPTQEAINHSKPKNVPYYSQHRKPSITPNQRMSLITPNTGSRQSLQTKECPSLLPTQEAVNHSKPKNVPHYSQHRKPSITPNQRMSLITPNTGSRQSLQTKECPSLLPTQEAVNHTKPKNVPHYCQHRKPSITPNQRMSLITPNTGSRQSLQTKECPSLLPTQEAVNHKECPLLLPTQEAQTKECPSLLPTQEAVNHSKPKNVPYYSQHRKPSITPNQRMSLITPNTGSCQSLQTKECHSLLPTQEAINHSKPKNVPHYSQHRKPSITPNQRMSLITPNTGSRQSLQTKECPLLLPTQEAINHSKPKNVPHYCQHRKPSITPNQRMSIITANTGSHQSLQTKECPLLLPTQEAINHSKPKNVPHYSQHRKLSITPNQRMSLITANTGSRQSLQTKECPLLLPTQEAINHSKPKNVPYYSQHRKPSITPNQRMSLITPNTGSCQSLQTKECHSLLPTQEAINHSKPKNVPHYSQHRKPSITPNQRMSLITPNTGSRQSLQTKECPLLLPTQEAINHSKPKNVPHYCQHRKPSITPNQRMSIITANTGSHQSLQTKECPLLLPTQEAVNHSKPKNVPHYSQHRKPSITPNQRMSLITPNTGSCQSLQTKECHSLLPTQEAINHSKPKNVPHYSQHRKPSITPNQRMSLITPNTGSRQSLQTKECPLLLPTQEAINHSKPKNVPHYCQHRKPSITPNQRMSIITANTGSHQSLQTKECPLLLPTQEAINHSKPKNVHYYCQHRKPSITPNQRMSIITANTGSHQSLQKNVPYYSQHRKPSITPNQRMSLITPNTGSRQSLQTKECPSLLPTQEAVNHSKPKNVTHYCQHRKPSITPNQRMSLITPNTGSRQSLQTKECPLLLQTQVAVNHSKPKNVPYYCQHRKPSITPNQRMSLITANTGSHQSLQTKECPLLLPTQEAINHSKPKNVHYYCQHRKPSITPNQRMSLITANTGSHQSLQTKECPSLLPTQEAINHSKPKNVPHYCQHRKPSITPNQRMSLITANTGSHQSLQTKECPLLLPTQEAINHSKPKNVPHYCQHRKPSITPNQRMSIITPNTGSRQSHQTKECPLLLPTQEAVNHSKPKNVPYTPNTGSRQSLQTKECPLLLPTQEAVNHSKPKNVPYNSQHRKPSITPNQRMSLITPNTGSRQSL